MTLKPNDSLQNGRYRIIKVLGQGGFGITYLAEHTMLMKQVCIKEFFPKEFCDRDDQTSEVSLGTANNRAQMEKYQFKFFKEAKLIATLDHPNIIRIHDVFAENNTAYFVMDYVDGVSLNELVNKTGPLSEADALQYVKAVGKGLSYVHGKGINHLDVKPGNIMVSKQTGTAVLIDFGLSKQYDESGDQTSSTPIGISSGYAPLEQYESGGVRSFSPQTDVYGLAATLYKLVTGNVPPSASEVMNDGLPELPSHLTASTKAAIVKGMQFRKNDRPQTIDEFLSMLEIDETATRLVDESELKSIPASDVSNRATESQTTILVDSKDTSELETVILPAKKEETVSRPTPPKKVDTAPVRPVKVNTPPAKVAPSRPLVEPKPQHSDRVVERVESDSSSDSNQGVLKALVVGSFICGVVMFVIALFDPFWVNLDTPTAFNPFGYIGGGLFAFSFLLGFFLERKLGYALLMIASLLLGFVCFYDAIDEDNSYWMMPDFNDSNTTVESTTNTIVISNPMFDWYYTPLLVTVEVDGKMISSTKSDNDIYFDPDWIDNRLTVYNLKPGGTYNISYSLPLSVNYGLFKSFEACKPVGGAQTVSTQRAAKKNAPIAKVTINGVSVDQDVYNDAGVMGLRAHINFNIIGAKDETYKCALYFYNTTTGQPLKDTNNSYCSSNGGVSVGYEFTPLYENTTFSDFTIFIPNSEIERDSPDCFFQVQFYRLSDSQFCDAYYNWYLTL